MDCQVTNIIRPSKGVEYIVHPNGGTMDIVHAILAADGKSDTYINKREVACLRGQTNYETLRNVWKFVKYNLHYRSDRPGYEVVQSPGSLFEKGRGDCKSYSISIAAILRALGFTNIRYRFVSYKKGGEYTHVYVVCRSSGKDVILDGVYHGFDKEASYIHKKDYPATGTSAVSGISGIHGDVQNFTKIAAAAAVLFFLYRFSK